MAAGYRTTDNGISKMTKRNRRASYDGNPGGKPIYPNEIDHGYEKPVAGDTAVMKKLVQSLRFEQGLKMAGSVAQRWLGASRTSKIASTRVTAAVAKDLAEALGATAISEGSMGWRFEPGARTVATEARVEMEVGRACAKNGCNVLNRKSVGGRTEFFIGGAEDLAIVYASAGGSVQVASIEVFDD